MMRRTSSAIFFRRCPGPAVAMVMAGLGIVLLFVAGFSCSGSIDPDLILQGGGLTVFDNTSMGYSQPSPEIAANPELLERFLNGDRLYELQRVASPAVVPGTGGLGPLYAGRSCTSCHQNDGRTKPTLWTHQGSGFDFSTFLVFFRDNRSDLFYRDYGRVLHDHAIAGVVPEGRLNVEYTEICDEFPTEDHERYCLAKPRYWISDWYTDPPDEADLELSVRVPLRHVGLGLMLAIDRDELSALANVQYPKFGITPKLQWIIERGKADIGIGGHKAQHSDLTIELGFSSNLGISSHRFPDNVAEGQTQAIADDGIEISDNEMADVDFYLHSLGVPARRNVDDPIVERGRELFQQAGCHLCHTPTMHTSPIPPQLIDGTPMPMLASQTIHPYSDFLLHDMGPDLGDDFSQFNATGDEWRTTPLWGIGLQQVVNGHTYLLHDGRARNLLEAIIWHRSEEGAVSTEIFRHMSKTDREALMRFVMSL